MDNCCVCGTEQSNKEFVNSLNEYYEYDVVTIVNKGNDRFNKKKMLSILSDYSKNGWKLHSMHSTQLGRNAVKALGLEINSPACEYVLIFERRINKI